MQHADRRVLEVLAQGEWHHEPLLGLGRSDILDSEDVERSVLKSGLELGMDLKE